jgi:alpha-tubulin suppressor-like RCC1 family protein
MACGSHHSAFITSDGLVYSMGANSFGQLGVGEPPSNSGNKYSPILVESLLQVEPYQLECGSNHCLLLARQGLVYAWGDNRHGQCGQGSHLDMQPELTYNTPVQVNIHNVINIDCGSDHSALVDGNGRLYTFGKNRNGQLGLGHFADEFFPQVVSRMVEQIGQVACGTDHTLLLTVTGLVYAMGSNAYG